MGDISYTYLVARALQGENFGDPIQPAPFAQTHFHPFPGFQGKFSPNPPVSDYMNFTIFNAKKNTWSFHTNTESLNIKIVLICLIGTRGT